MHARQRLLSGTSGHSSGVGYASTRPRRLCEPYLRAEYGEEFDFKAPVKLLDKWLHGLPSEPGEQVIVLSQVLAADVRRPHYQQRARAADGCSA